MAITNYFYVLMDLSLKWKKPTILFAQVPEDHKIG